MRALSVAAVLALALALTGCGGKKKTVSGGKPLKAFTIGETDFKLTPSAFTIAKAGTYTFHAINRGQTEHSLEVEGRGVEKEIEGNLSPGQSGDLTVVLTPGTYEIYCPVDDHKGKGMEGTITVKGAKRSAPPATTSTQEGKGY